MKSIKYYIWFIKTSQSFMQGTKHPVIIFVQSVIKGFGYVKSMNEWDKQPDKLTAYANLDRTIEF